MIVTEFEGFLNKKETGTNLGRICYSTAIREELYKAVR